MLLGSENYNESEAKGGGDEELASHPRLPHMEHALESQTRVEDPLNARVMPIAGHPKMSKL